MEHKARLVGRSLALRLVDCGSCNACESELAMLFGPDFDAQHFGIEMVPSPRHADGLIVTGPGTSQMTDALIRTAEAVGEPRLVVALGDCAISGHVHRDGYAAKCGVAASLDVDLQIPGCPPAPGEILGALRRLMRANAAGQGLAAAD